MTNKYEYEKNCIFYNLLTIIYIRQKYVYSKNTYTVNFHYLKYIMCDNHMYMYIINDCAGNRYNSQIIVLIVLK